MSTIKSNLIDAEKKASILFSLIEEEGLICPVKSEKELNLEVFDLAYQLYGIKKYWHKRIVRAGKNTLYPYNENPENLLIQENDIVFIDFGPIFDEWEADFGRTYVLGSDKLKCKLKQDIELAWEDCKLFFMSKKGITGAELYHQAVFFARKYGWQFGGEIAGHTIGHFPHEELGGEDKTNYIHPENHERMDALNNDGTMKEWILEIHFVDIKNQIGGFFEQLLT